MLLPRVEQCDALLALDAANLGECPGKLRVLEGEAFDEFVRLPRCSVHELGLRDLLDAARLPAHCRRGACWSACSRNGSTGAWPSRRRSRRRSCCARGGGGNPAEMDGRPTRAETGRHAARCGSYVQQRSLI